MSLARKIASNTLWQIVGKLVTAVLGVISIKYITNYLTPTEYGQYTTIYDFTALFAIVADFGLFTIAVREMAKAEALEVAAGRDGKSGVERILGNILSIRTVLAALSLGLGWFVAMAVPAYSGTPIPTGVFIVAVATVITLIAGTMSSILQYQLRMVWASIALTIGKIITVAYILAVILVWYPGAPEVGFHHLLISWIVGGLFTLVITFFAAKKRNLIGFHVDLSFWKKLLPEALPYGTALMLGSMYFRMGTIVMSLYGMQVQIGFYGVPMRLLEILQIIPHYFMNSVLPELTRAVQNNSERASKIIRYSLNALALLGIPTFAGGNALSWELTAAVSSPEFLTHRLADGTLAYGSDFAMKILLAATAFTFLHIVFSYVLVAKGMQKQVLKANAIGLFVNVVINFSLAPRYGFIGASIAAVSTEIVMFISLNVLAHKYAKIKNIWDFTFLAKVSASALVMHLALIYVLPYISPTLHSASLFVLIPFGGIIFGTCLALLGGINKELIRTFLKPTL